MDEVVDDEASQLERMRQQRRRYLDFLSLNYRVFDRYAQIREIFAFTIKSVFYSAKTHAERLREQRQMDDIDLILVKTSNLILNLEKNSESVLFSD